jgi:hypothetical protein
VAVRLSLRGTHRGSFQGIPATGRPVAFTRIEIYRVSGDRLAEEWVSPDVNTYCARLPIHPNRSNYSKAAALPTHWSGLQGVGTPRRPLSLERDAIRE